MPNFYKIVILSLLIMFSGCRDDKLCGEGTVTIAGICFIENGKIPIKKELEETVRVLEEELIYAGYDTHNLVETFDENNVQVEFVTFRIAMYCGHYDKDIYYCDNILNGINYDGNDIYVRYKSCLGLSVLAHELLHSVEKYYLNGMRHDHMTPWFFYEFAENTEADYNEIIEWRVTKRLVCSLGSCEDDRIEEICDNLNHWLEL